ncbi:hypothetical protein RJ55_08274 [Drechmeria coniospora]|nr:hypothetical protein RJ55_08274 [Drechmeria coniospora]
MTMHARAYACLALCGVVVASNVPILPRQTTAAPSTTTAAPAPQVTAITGCHLNGASIFCFGQGLEYRIKSTVTQMTSVPASFTGCHNHGAEMFCVDAADEDVAVEPVTPEPVSGGHAGHDHEGEDAGATAEHGHCHYHAGVEHCEPDGKSESASVKCDAVHRDYDVGLRVGLLFAILATSALGVFGPILMNKLLPRKLGLIFLVLKQFGTGIIISTAFVHLYTHASLMFGNKCIGNLGYESVASAIVMAGLFLSFVIEYGGHRIVLAKARSAETLSPETKAKAILSTEVVSILVMEAGILFHSLLIGLTLVVAADSFILTLFVVILFHQMFEGLALGTRIATIGTGSAADDGGADNAHDTDKSTSSPTDEAPSVSSSAAPPAGLSMKKKLGLASLFAFITPLGMAIGIGVLQKFNGNDRSTLVAIGTLDALSAGILVWVGVVEMWAADWMLGSHGKKPELSDASILTVTLAGFGLVAGMVLMSLLGKWA